MIDPTQALAMATKSLLVPSSSTTSVAPIPTVVPTLPTFEKIHAKGANTLWVVFVLMLLSTIVFAILAYRAPVQKRLFHLLTVFITAFATISYFAMATGDGNSFKHIVIHDKNQHVPDTFEHIFRQVFWARYVDMAITTPLILLNLSFLAGINGANILVLIVSDLSMVFLGLFVAFGRRGGQKWGYFVMALVAYLIIIYQLAMPGRRAVKAKSQRTSRLFTSLAAYTMIIWLIYPIVWAVAYGTRRVSVDSEVIVFAILDLLAKPVFGAWLLYANPSTNSPAIEGFWANGFAQEGTIRIDEED